MFKYSKSKTQQHQLHPHFKHIFLCIFFHLFNDTTKACVCFEDNTAYFGNNHRFGAENPQFDRLGCQSSCESHPECKYWTFSKPSEAGEEGLCYLKTKRGNMKYNLTDYVSGSKKCRLPEWQGQILMANICNLYILQLWCYLSYIG